MGFFSGIKNYLIVGLLALLLVVSGYAYYKSCRLDSVTKTVNEQKFVIAAKDAVISQYKANIEQAKAHQSRVIVIQKKGKVIQKTIDHIIKTEVLSDEEKSVAADITDMFNGVQSGDNKTGTGGKVLPGSDKAGTDKTGNGQGTAD
jgi:hypothetical protein